VATLASDHADEAHDALTTALGPRVARPDASAWGSLVAPFAERSMPPSARLRAGRPYGPGAILEDLQRGDLSALAVERRLEELVVLAGRPRPVPEPVLAATLDPSIAAASSLFSAHVRR